MANPIPLNLVGDWTPVLDLLTGWTVGFTDADSGKTTDLIVTGYETNDDGDLVWYGLDVTDPSNPKAAAALRGRANERHQVNGDTSIPNSTVASHELY